TKVGGGGGPLILNPANCVPVTTSSDVRWNHVPGKPNEQVIAGYTGDASNLTGAPWTNDFYVNTAALHVGPHKLVAQPGIPTVSEWGVAVMTLLVLSAATVVLIRRRSSQPA
ncbi:MAG: IPTL-CTERM sorting domain-containing protein, partial [Phycisphaerales bacterium]|nr:IPTL-CTERM sorting domain-containing protein [Phycisphaerales bacterium]